MISDLSKYDQYLVDDEKGLRVSADCPADIRKELVELNREYRELYGTDLVII